jgi:hypothetical protein
MVDPTPTSTLQKTNTATSTDVPPTPLRCISGALISGGIAFLLYRLTLSIVLSFATKPVSLTNSLAARIGTLVRTAVVGVSTLATGIFGIVALGLTALAIQLVIQRLLKPEDSTSDV